jgi:hypothetical protein
MDTTERYFLVAAVMSFLTLIALTWVELMPY